MRRIARPLHSLLQSACNNQENRGHNWQGPTEDCPDVLCHVSSFLFPKLELAGSILPESSSSPEFTSQRFRERKASFPEGNLNTFRALAKLYARSQKCPWYQTQTTSVLSVTCKPFYHQCCEGIKKRNGSSSLVYSAQLELYPVYYFCSSAGLFF